MICEDQATWISLGSDRIKTLGSFSTNINHFLRNKDHELGLKQKKCQQMKARRLAKTCQLIVLNRRNMRTSSSHGDRVKNTEIAETFFFPLLRKSKRHRPGQAACHNIVLRNRDGFSIYTWFVISQFVDLSWFD